MIIQKSRLCLAEIKYFIDRCGRLIAVDLENGGWAADDHVGQRFEVSLQSWMLLCPRLVPTEPST